MLHLMKRMEPLAKPTRRTFLKLSAGALGGLMIGTVPLREAVAEEAGGYAIPFVHIKPDNTVLVLSKHLDKGQGTATGLATLVADELDAAIEQMAVDFAPSNPELYKNLAFGVQGTGGSTAMANSYDQYRQAGAIARQMLIAAAASEWGMAPEQITIKAGMITGDDDRQASFGEMAAKAAAQPVPEQVVLKTPEQWVYIGKDMPRIELPKKTQGSVGLFGLDYKPEGILYAVTARSPKFGGMVASVDDAAARAMAGVVDVITIPQGVVVLAEDTWTAMQAREELLIEWDFSQAETRGTDQMIADYRALLDQPGKPGLARGDAAGALAGAETVIEADYVFPFLAHAPLEPLNATIEYDGQSAKLTYGSQFQTVDHGTVAAVLGLPMEKIQIVTTWAGGSFGRRATLDGHLAAETAMLGKAWFDKHGAARPIKLTYSREDDILGGYYRPLAVHRVRAAVGADGKIAGWEQRVVSKSIFIGTAFEPYVVHEGVDHMTIEGLMDRYAVADVSIEAHHPETALPVLWWRSVGHSFAGYVAETMMDELADAAGQDPVEFRLAHLGEAPREAAVLRLAAEKAGWGEALPEGRYRGVAVQKSFDSYVAQVAEISLREDGTVKVEKVTAAVDCGVPINPDNIRAQIQGGLGMGLGTVLREEITLTDGEVDQWNYPDYQPLRITDMPEVEVHIMASSEAPTGIGEPGLPPIGPAVANAVYRATGQRVRELPFAKHGLA